MGVPVMVSSMGQIDIFKNDSYSKRLYEEKNLEKQKQENINMNVS